MEVSEANITQNAKKCTFPYFGAKVIIWLKKCVFAIFCICSILCTFGSKWPQKASRNRYPHKLLRNWSQKMNFECRNAKKAELCPKVSFLLNLITFHHFYGITSFCTLWGPMLKTHKILVVYWPFWDPKMQNCEFCLNLAKICSFCVNGGILHFWAEFLKMSRKLLFWVKITFCVLGSQKGQ